eukprot:1122960-Pyramimonas_sp.AAC.1
MVACGAEPMTVHMLDVSTRIKLSNFQTCSHAEGITVTRVDCAHNKVNFKRRVFAVHTSKKRARRCTG